jgi:hypothetical protein
MFYDIQNNNAPRYLCDLIPPTIQSTTVYPLRNGSDIIIPFCRLSNTYDSFIPSTIRQWNSRDPSLGNVDYIGTWVHYYFVYHKTFVIISSFFFLPMIPTLTLYKLKLN